MRISDWSSDVCSSDLNGIYGRVDPDTGKVDVWDAPRGRGPYGIATTPSGQVWYASLAGNHIARIDMESGKATVVEPPTPGQGGRRVWPDSHGRPRVSERNSGTPTRSARPGERR